MASSDPSKYLKATLSTGPSPSCPAPLCCCCCLRDRCCVSPRSRRLAQLAALLLLGWAALCTFEAVSPVVRALRGDLVPLLSGPGGPMGLRRGLIDLVGTVQVREGEGRGGSVVFSVVNVRD